MTLATIARRGAIIGLCLVSLGTSGCGVLPRDMRVETMNSPAPPGSIVPQVTATANDDLILSWFEPLPNEGYNFRMSIRHRENWSDNRTIATGPEISMFSTDLPGIAEMPGGVLLAYWELRDTRNGDRYATAIQISSSEDRGKTWSVPSRPYWDVASGQHSFISAFPVSQLLGLVWLDADVHGLTPQGEIGLRYVSIDQRRRIISDSFIDPVTCECCPTSSAVTKRGPVVVYRAQAEPPNTRRSNLEGARPTIRDIYLTRLENGKWMKPHRVYADNWVISACPDNGPAVDSSGDRVAVAWWTRAGDMPKVELALSSDAGNTFGRPIRVDRKAGEGQVTVAWLPGRDAVVVGWLEDHKVWARSIAVSGKLGKPIMLGPSPPHSRLPKWVVRNGEIIAVWTEQGDFRSVKVARLKL